MCPAACCCGQETCCKRELKSFNSDFLLHNHNGEVKTANSPEKCIINYKRALNPLSSGTLGTQCEWWALVSAWAHPGGRACRDEAAAPHSPPLPVWGQEGPARAGSWNPVKYGARSPHMLYLSFTVLLASLLCVMTVCWGNHWLNPGPAANSV